MKRVGSRFLAIVLSAVMLLSMNGMSVLASTVITKDRTATDTDVSSYVTADNYSEDTYTLTFGPGTDSTGQSYAIQVPQGKYIVFHEGYLYVYMTKMAAKNDIASDFQNYEAHKKLYAYTRDSYVQTGWSDGTNSYTIDTVYQVSSNLTLVPTWEAGYVVTFSDASNSVNGTQVRVPEGGHFYIYESYRTGSSAYSLVASYYYRVFNSANILVDYGTLPLAYSGKVVSDFKVGSATYEFTTDELEIPVTGDATLTVDWEDAVTVTFSGGETTTLQLRAGQYIRNDYGDLFYVYNSKSDANYGENYVNRISLTTDKEGYNFKGWLYDGKTLGDEAVVQINSNTEFTGKYISYEFVTIKDLSSSGSEKIYYIDYGEYIRFEDSEFSVYHKNVSGSYTYKDTYYPSYQSGKTLVYLYDGAGNKYELGDYIEVTEGLVLTAVYYAFDEFTEVDVYDIGETEGSSTPTALEFPTDTYIKYTTDNKLAAYVKVDDDYIKTTIEEDLSFNISNGDTFTGFKDGDENTYGKNDYIPVSAGLTLYAQSAEVSDTYTVTLSKGDSDTGSNLNIAVPKNGSLYLGDTTSSSPYYMALDEYGVMMSRIEYTAYTRDGYMIVGWTDGTDTYNAEGSIDVTADITLTPIFEKARTYTVKDTVNNTTESLTAPEGGVLYLNHYGYIGVYSDDQYTGELGGASISEGAEGKYIAGYTIGGTDYLFESDSVGDLDLSVSDISDGAEIVPIYKDVISLTFTLGTVSNTIKVPEGGSLCIYESEMIAYYPFNVQYIVNYSSIQELDLSGITGLLKGYTVDGKNYLFNDDEVIETGAISSTSTITAIIDNTTILSLTATDGTNSYTIKVPEGGYLYMDEDGDFKAYYSDDTVYEEDGYCWQSTSFTKDGAVLAGFKIGDTEYLFGDNYSIYSETITSVQTITPLFKERVSVTFTSTDAASNSYSISVTSTEGYYIRFYSDFVGIYTSLAESGWNETSYFEYSDFTNSGYNLTGWTYNGTTYKTGDIVKVASTDMTFTAVWTAKETAVAAYSVTLKAGTGATGDDVVLALPSNTYDISINRYTGRIDAYDEFEDVIFTTYFDFECGDKFVTGFSSDTTEYAFNPLSSKLWINLENRAEDMTLTADWGDRYELSVVDGDGNKVDSSYYPAGTVYAKYEGNDVIGLYRLPSGDGRISTFYLDKSGYEIKSVKAGTTDITDGNIVEISSATTFTVTYEEYAEVTITLKGGSKAPSKTLTIKGQVGGRIRLFNDEIYVVDAYGNQSDNAEIDFGVSESEGCLTAFTCGDETYDVSASSSCVIRPAGDMTLTAVWAEPVDITLTYSGFSGVPTSSMTGYVGEELEFDDGNIYIADVRNNFGSHIEDYYGYYEEYGKDFAFTVDGKTYYSYDTISIASDMTIDVTQVDMPTLSLVDEDGAVARSSYIYSGVRYITISSSGWIWMYNSMSDYEYGNEIDFLSVPSSIESKTGYEITGWTVNGTEYGVDELISVSGNTTISPVYGKTVTITLDPGDGAEGSASTIEVSEGTKVRFGVVYDSTERIYVYDANGDDDDDSIGAATFYRAGYGVTGLNIGGTSYGIDDTYTLTEDTVITAEWGALNEVTLKAGDGSGSDVVTRVLSSGSIYLGTDMIFVSRYADEYYYMDYCSYSFTNGSKVQT
nr:hypothetical protein [Eubacterium sp.]